MSMMLLMLVEVVALSIVLMTRWCTLGWCILGSGRLMLSNAIVSFMLGCMSVDSGFELMGCFSVWVMVLLMLLSVVRGLVG